MSMNTTPHTMTINIPTLLNIPVRAGTKFQSAMATMDASIVQKPAFLLVNFGAIRAPMTMKDVPMAS